MVEHHGLDSERSRQLHQSELLDLAAARPRIAEQYRVARRVSRGAPDRRRWTGGWQPSPPAPPERLSRGARGR